MIQNDKLRGKLLKGAEDLGAKISEGQVDKFMFFMQELLSWNNKMNLTTIVNEEEVITKHFLDSISILSLISKSAVNLIDVGTGGGFPGIPVKICMPTLQVSLLDSTKKKTEFLAHAGRYLDLDLDVLHLRAEDAGKSESLRENFDVAVSRAVADLATLSEYCLPFVAVGGIFIAMKAYGVQDELSRAHRAIETLGGGDQKVITYEIPGTDYKRTCVVIQKVSNTPDKYPRKAGIPSKRPL